MTAILANMDRPPLIPLDRAVRYVVIALASTGAALAIATLLQKLAFTLVLAAFGTAAYLFCRMAAPASARPAVVIPAFFVAANFAAYVRQSTFELQTVGHLTTLTDPCAQMFLPLVFGAIAVATAATALLASLLARLQLPASSSSEGAVRARRRFAYPIVLAGVVAAGIASGLATWSDWQVAQPCL